MEDVKSDRMLNVIIIGNSGKLWMYLVNVYEYRILKIKQMMGVFGLSNDLILIRSCYYYN